MDTLPQNLCTEIVSGHRPAQAVDSVGSHRIISHI
jgi:hypothetical protein